MPEPRSAFEPHWRNVEKGGASSPDTVTLSMRRLAIVTVEARKGRASDLTSRLTDAFGVTLPLAARVARARDGLAAYAIAPGTWLMTMPGAEEAFVGRLTKAAGDAGSVVDQSHGKASLRISGSRARDVLDQLCRLDLHSSAFPPDRCGITHIAHVAVLLARADDGAPAETPAFDLIIPSTFALGVLEAVETAADEVGWMRG